MDTLEAVRECLKNWSKGGDSECRNIVFAPHCNPTDPKCLDILTTVYHTLLCATLLTWSPPHPLTPTAFVDFVQSVLRGLPSSSNETEAQPSHVAIFGDYLVDMIWSVDSQLDELLGEARSAATVTGDGKIASKDLMALANKAKKAQQNAETDKQRIPSIVMKLLEYRIITPEHCRERLDTAVLASVGLIQDKVLQDKKEVRTRTGLFYKQNKFNLLREQSEGYSKLVVELTSSLGPPHSPQTGQPTEPYAVIEDRARPVWEKVISLIGYFDLDPNRALDIILDVLSQHLATHHSFFLALLSFSPWSGSYRRPVPNNEVMDTKADVPPDLYKGKSLDEILSLAEDNSLPPTVDNHEKSGSRVLAQVLGFKFSYYQSGDVLESTPKNLYLTAAILIREGFISLEDLYPHLSPDDEDMGKARQEYLADVQVRIAGAKNSLLAMAAPLESGSSSQSKPSAASAAESKKIDSKAANQKVGLLISLLSVGALKPAIAIMSKFRWLVDANTEIADLMIRVLKVSLFPLYDAKFPKERRHGFTSPKARYGPSGLVYPGPRKPVLTLWAPTPPSTNTTDFVFFYAGWEDRIPISTTLDDLEDVVEPLLKFIGLHVSRDPLFLTKFLRLGRLHLQSTVPINPVTKKPSGEVDQSHPIRRFWFAVLRQYLLPALSLIKGNAVCTVEVWNIIRQYPTPLRWRLYGEWKNGTYRSHPELRIKEVQANRESKGILRRLSLNTIDSLAGPVAKLAHSNPCILFANAVNQIMAYDNLANVVIQALRYVTNMGFDVLVFIVLGALADPNKQRVKDDGVNTSDWLQSLASFIGMLFRRYSADILPVLQYIVHQLFNDQTTEIVVLRELIWKMAGIEPLPSLSESQMVAMAGGPALRIEAIASATRGARLDPNDAILKGPQRLGKNLLESGLALPLLVQVAQQREACVYKAPNTHLKSLAGLYDATHGVLLQYLELLTSPTVIAPKDYATKVLPPLAELGRDYGICAPICMQIIRPVLNASLLSSALAMQEQERLANEEVEKRLKATLTAKREPGASASRVASPAVGTPSTSETPEPKVNAEEHETTMEVDSSSLVVSQKENSPWVPELAALFDDVKVIAPGNTYDVIGPGFYVTFWQLSTYDLSPPGAKYDEEGAKLRALSRQEDSRLNAAERSSDRSKRLTASSHRTWRDRYTMFVNVLAKEYKEQTISRAFTIKRLAREKQYWFAHCPKSGTLINSIIEHCIQPRCLLSPMDADFCAQFIKVMHLQGTPGFHTLGCYDKLLGDHVKVVVFSCSEYEARNYGRFLLGILRDLLSWHLDEAAYIQDNRTKVGGKTVILPGLQSPFTSKNIVPTNVLRWPEFQRIMRKWHTKLSKSFIDCIQTGEFMHVYNAIVVMKEILDVFPLASVNNVGPSINTAMDRFLETEERGDLKILARSYSASLKRKEADWAPKLPAHLNGTASPRPPPQATHSPIPEKPRAVQAPTASITDSKRNMPQPSSSTPSAPRAQIASQNTAASDKPAANLNLTKLAMDSIPRPEVVKRVRPDNKASDSPKSQSEVASSSKPEPQPIQAPERRGTPIAPSAGRDEISGPQDSQALSQTKVPGPNELIRPDGVPVMPPPVVPSQTALAQELRETARQTIGRSERPDARSQNGSAAPSPIVRSPSPSSRPGTRNPSNESRTSGGKARSERGSDDRREREGRLEARDPSGSLARRDSLTHTRSERSTRGREDERDRDRGRDRDRHSERDRDKDRDRERDRDRDRDRERDRDRDRDRDRHRRDGKDRDRDVRKERDGAPSRSQAVPSPAAAADDRSLPSRPDVSRHRNTPQNGDDSLGKRRRGAEDEPERGSKRSSRKESHRDDRSRRPPEKDERAEPDRRRKDRDGAEADTRGSSSDKSSEKRPSAEITSKPSLPTNTPLAPRAWGSAEPRGKSDLLSNRDRHRDNIPTANAPSNQQESESKNAGSLRSRIGGIDKEPPLTFKDAGRALPEDERESLRKRSASERDPDPSDHIAGPSHDYGMLPPKRPRTGGSGGNRNRYSANNHGLAKKTLPIDPTAHDRSQRR